MPDRDDDILRGSHPVLIDSYKKLKDAVKRRTGVDISLAGASRSPSRQQSFYEQGKSPYAGNDPSAPHVRGVAVDLNWRRLSPDVRKVVEEEAKTLGFTQGGTLANGYDEHHHFALSDLLNEGDDLQVVGRNDISTASSTTASSSQADDTPQLAGSDIEIVGKDQTIPSETGTDGMNLGTPPEKIPTKIPDETVNSQIVDAGNAVPTSFDQENYPSEDVLKVGTGNQRLYEPVKGSTPEEAYDNAVSSVDPKTIENLSLLAKQGQVSIDFSNKELVRAYETFRSYNKPKGTSEPLPDSDETKFLFTRYLYNINNTSGNRDDAAQNKQVEQNARVDLALSVVGELRDKLNRPISGRDLSSPEYAWLLQTLTDPNIQIGRAHV